MHQTASTRWCPTAEQLILLEEMYRSGIRNPNASQIRKITAHLSSFGKIEGKNVFYWFQNHKARDKHKLSRRLSRQHHLFLDYYYHFYNLKEASQFPTSQPYQYQQTSAPHRFFNQDGIGNYVTHGKNLPCNIEKCTTSTPIYASYAEYIKSSYDAHPCYKPLKTLDLFPTTSTGLKDECRS